MKLTPLAQRLARVAAEPDAGWNLLAENVPVWPVPPPLPALRWSDGDDCYAPSQGTDVLLEALAARGRAQGAAIGPESLLVTNGGFDALALAVRRLRAAGARRVVCAGPILESVARLFKGAGLRLDTRDWSELLAGEGWLGLRLGPADLVYVNTPHNPTGVCLAEPVARRLLADQRRRGFTLLLDVVYDAFCYRTGCRPAVIALVEDWHGVFAFNSFSKGYGAPGLRVGWLTGEPGAVRELTAQVEVERIAVSTGAQARAAELLAHGNAPLVEAVAHGRKLVLDWAAAQQVEVGAGHGGTQVWCDLGTGDAERFADRLMADERVVVTTGRNYYPGHPLHIRLPTGLAPARLEEGLRAIARVRDLMRR